MLDLLRQPHYKFTGATPSGSHYDLRDLMDLGSLESLVPGALVYGYAGGSRKRHRVRKMNDGEIPSVALTRYEVIVPVHGAFLVETHLRTWGLFVAAQAGAGAEAVYPLPTRPEWLEKMREHGAEQIKRLGERGVLMGNIVEAPRPWQSIGVTWALSRPWVAKIWPTGTGKTAGALADAAAVVSEKHPGDIVIACPGGARPTWLVQTPQYLGWEAHMVKPDSQQRKSDEDLEDYVARCRGAKRPAVVIVGFENLVDHLAKIRELLRPSVLILDEVHKLGSHSRWTAIYQPDGSVVYKPKTTSSGKINQAAAVMQLASLDTIRFRCGMSATPMGEGRPRRLWSPFDLLSRGGFGYSYWNTYAVRYCNGQEGDYGMDDSGQSYSKELQDRLRFIAHEVPYSVTRKGMPPLTVNIVRLPKELQQRPERFSEGKTFNQAIKGALTEAAVADPHDKQGLLKKGRTVEYRLMEACSRKRGWVIDRAVEGLHGGGKVVVFTGRRREVDVWRQRIERVVTKGDSKLAGFRSYGYHGGCNDAERTEILDQFKNGSGPLLLVATGQSIGTSVDGLQTTDVAIFAMLPWTADEFIQWRGRFDRLGGTPTVLEVPVAVDTYDERVVSVLTEKFGNIEELFTAGEIKGLDEKLQGTEDRQKVLAEMLSGLGVM